MAVLPYYALIAVTYASFGVSPNDLYSSFSPVVLLVAAATALQQRAKVLSHLSTQGFAWVDSIYLGSVFGTTALELIEREVRHVRANPVNDVFIEA